MLYHTMCCHSQLFTATFNPSSVKVLPTKMKFGCGKQKSLAARAVEYGGCGKTSHLNFLSFSRVH